PSPSPSVTLPPPIGQPGGLRWSDPATWPSRRVPTRDNDVLIPAGMVVEVDTLQAEARTVTVGGTLRASRGVASRLALYGNLIVRGVLDYGRPNDRVFVPASIRFFLNEASYVGGPAMEPLSSDVGLWAIGDAQVWVHGTYRDTWSPLVETARAGSIEIAVDPAWARNWRVGDLVVVGPSNLRVSDGDFQDEVRRITADLGGGRFQVDAALAYAHEVTAVGWTDAWGDAWTERLAAKVANLTSNITFEAGDPNHRPHIMFMGRAKHYVEDLAIVNFSPMPKVNPMGRWAWHNHRQGDGSRGSYLRRTRMYGGPGDGIHIHESFGIEVEDLVVYNQARAYVELPGGSFFVNTVPFKLEHDPLPRGGTQGRAADDCWIDRPLIMRWGSKIRDFRNSGIYLGSSVNCVVAGAVTTGASGGSFSSGMHWPQSGIGEPPFVYRAESNSNQSAGFLAWRNNPPIQRIVDLLTWLNGDHGLFWGAYRTHFWAHNVRAIGNGKVQLGHVAVNWGITGFLADGMGVPGAAGIKVGNYVAESTTDTVYEDGVVRNVAVNARHSVDPSVGAISWVQFARIVWDPARGVSFDGSAVPPNGSHFRFRDQRNLPRASNFALYRVGDPGAPRGALLDPEYNALRVDNDTQGTRPRPPRVVWSTPAPADESLAAGSITLAVRTDASEVEFYQANQSLGRVRVLGGYATLTVNMANHPRRRAYFWALAYGSNGAVNASRVLRVMKF
ncbi:MAG: G8 domain-containing protein, partial [bacterium]